MPSSSRIARLIVRLARAPAKVIMLKRDVRMDTGTIACPKCRHKAVEPIPTDRCLFFYQCLGCGVVLKPKPGDCCVFCSYSETRCKSRQ